MIDHVSLNYFCNAFLFTTRKSLKLLTLAPGFSLKIELKEFASFACITRHSSATVATVAVTATVYNSV
jgi:hypothetical protein